MGCGMLRTQPQSEIQIDDRLREPTLQSPNAPALHIVFRDRRAVRRVELARFLEVMPGGLELVCSLMRLAGGTRPR